MHLNLDPWIPTRSGTLTLEQALTGPAAPLHTGHALSDAALLRLLATLAALSQGHPRAYLHAHTAGFHLHGERPFLQQAMPHTADLPWESIDLLHLDRASGRDVTLLAGTLEAHPTPHTPPQALLALITAHQFAPSRGRTRWGYSKDAPLARNLTYHAHGPTLAATLALNAPNLTTTELRPTWEQAPNPQRWRTNQIVPTDRVTLTTWPGWAVTLEEAPRIRHVRFASGTTFQPDASLPLPDPHVHQIPDKPAATRKTPRQTQQAYHTIKNPADRSAHRALAQTLLDTLLNTSGHLLPHSFVRARNGMETTSVNVTGLATRMGQPVVLETLDATLPWPQIPPEQAAQALQTALTGHAALHDVLRQGYTSALDPRQGREETEASPALHQYWHDLWPQLSLTLTGQSAVAEFVEHCQQAIRLALTDALDTLPRREPWDRARATLGAFLSTPSRVGDLPLPPT